MGFPGSPPLRLSAPLRLWFALVVVLGTLSPPSPLRGRGGPQDAEHPCPMGH